jgi:hypothetical protein
MRSLARWQQIVKTACVVAGTLTVIASAWCLGDSSMGWPLGDVALGKIRGTNPTIQQGGTLSCSDVNPIPGTKGANGCLNDGEECTSCDNDNSITGSSSWISPGGGPGAGQTAGTFPCTGNRYSGTCYIWGYTDPGNLPILKCNSSTYQNGTCDGNVPQTLTQNPLDGP